MLDEKTLKASLARAQSLLADLDREIGSLEGKQSNASRMLETAKQQAIASERRTFDARIKEKLDAVDSTCESMKSRVEALVDSFPGAETREFAGKYEVKSIEAQLAEHYPKALVEQYIGLNVIEFQSEADAFRTYTRLEKRVASLSSGSLVTALFDGITNGLAAISSAGSAGGKVVFAIVLALMLTMVVSPFLFLTVFSVIAASSFVRGFGIHAILRDLYSIKAFLNESYDEDIFQDAREDTLNIVNEFVEKTQAEYREELMQEEFQMNPAILRDIEAKHNAEQETIATQINLKRQERQVKENEIQQMLEELSKMEEMKAKAAAEAKGKFLETLNWKYEWNENILLDVTNNSKVVLFPNKKCNTLFYCQDQQNLLQFETLCVFQNMIQMHPLYTAQVVLDYKLSGRGIMPFTRVNPLVLTLASDAEAIGKQTTKVATTIRDRISNILQSCEDIESFNQLMAEYGTAGENYVIVHVFGLGKLTSEFKDFLRNGKSVGYFFKFYFTTEELKAMGKDFPISEFDEWFEITETAIPRNRAAIERALTPTA